MPARATPALELTTVDCKIGDGLLVCHEIAIEVQQP